MSDTDTRIQIYTCTFMYVLVYAIPHTVVSVYDRIYDWKAAAAECNGCTESGYILLALVAFAFLF